jgi:polyphosphate kinase 2
VLPAAVNAPVAALHAGKVPVDTAGLIESGAHSVAKHKKRKYEQDKLGRKDYLAQLELLQLELDALARWIRRTGQRLLVLIEGRDTAGKGGVIDAISGHINPRQCRVVALPKPSERERGEWYFQRYVAHLPAAGEIALFDRSWYNRAGVEKVMGFASESQVAAFLQQAPAFERLLVDDGMLLFKYWLTVDQVYQEERFAERRAEPLKRWKISPIDLQAREKYLEYGQAREAMLKATHTRHAPWTLVNFNDQRAGRLRLIRNLLERIPDTRIKEPLCKFPSLQGKPRRESFSGRLRPI